jgi:hypothetical protein
MLQPEWWSCQLYPNQRRCPAPITLEGTFAALGHPWRPRAQSNPSTRLGWGSCGNRSCGRRGGTDQGLAGNRETSTRIRIHHEARSNCSVHQSSAATHQYGASKAHRATIQCWYPSPTRAAPTTQCQLSYPSSKKHRTKASICVPRMFNHTHSNNMINSWNVSNKQVIFLT